MTFEKGSANGHETNFTNLFKIRLDKYRDIAVSFFTKTVPRDGSIAQRSPLFLIHVSRGPRVLVQCFAANIRC
jgi:hypothetical protein